jgi:hypothetical protein
MKEKMIDTHRNQEPAVADAAIFPKVEEEERCPTGEVRDGDKMWPFGEYFY